MTRGTAEQRREEIRAVATEMFAQAGFHGVSVKSIAQAVGISEPYVFRLFGTKRALFIDRVRNSYDILCASLVEAGSRAPDATIAQRLEAMGSAYVGLLADRHVLLLQLQGFAACSDDVVRDAVRECFGQLWRAASETSGATPEVTKSFIGLGMLSNVLVAVGADETETAWSREAAVFIALG